MKELTPTAYAANRYTAQLQSLSLQARVAYTEKQERKYAPLDAIRRDMAARRARA